MNEDTLKGQWTQLKGRIREQTDQVQQHPGSAAAGQAEQRRERAQQRETAR